MLRPLFVAAVTLVPLAALPAHAAVVSFDEYRALVRECRSFLTQREITESAAKRLAVRLRAVTGVAEPGKSSVTVDTKADADALDAVTGTTPDKKLADRFAVLEEQLNRRLAPSKSDPHTVAERVLAANEFESSRVKPLEGDEWDWSAVPKWFQPVGKALEPTLKAIGKAFVNFGKWFVKLLENAFRAIGKFFRWLFNRFPQNKNFSKTNPFASLGNNILLTLYFVATVAATVGVYFLTRYLFDLYETKTGRKRRALHLGGDLDLAGEGITDPMATARERASDGDYRSAIRLIYIASLWKLGESGVLTLEKNRTNWEYQRALRQKTSTVYDDLLPATRLFDRVWYGKQVGTRAEFEAVSAIHDRLPTQNPANATDTALSTTEAKP